VDKVMDNFIYTIPKPYI